MKLTKKVLANAFALTGGIYWIINYLFFLILPSASAATFSRLAQGAGITGVDSASFDLTVLIFGGLMFIIFAWLFGYILGWSIEYFSR